MREHMREAEFSLQLIDYAPHIVEEAWHSMLIHEGAPEDAPYEITYWTYLFDETGETIVEAVKADSPETATVQRRRAVWTTND